MKNLFSFLVLLTAVITASPSYACSYLQDKYGLSSFQLLNLYQNFELGKEKELGTELAAISFYESSAGKFLVNRNDPSAGSHHVLLSHALLYFGLESTQANLNYVEDALVSSVGLSASIALKELEWWLKRHNGDSFKAIRSYNQGYFWKLPKEQRVRSYNYAVNVTSFMEDLDKCNWDIKK